LWSSSLSSQVLGSQACPLPTGLSFILNCIICKLVLTSRVPHLNHYCQEKSKGRQWLHFSVDWNQAPCPEFLGKLSLTLLQKISLSFMNWAHGSSLTHAWVFPSRWNASSPLKASESQTQIHAMSQQWLSPISEYQFPSKSILYFDTCLYPILFFITYCLPLHQPKIWQNSHSLVSYIDIDSAKHFVLTHHQLSPSFHCLRKDTQRQLL
jgi:hypothetical protein